MIRCVIFDLDGTLADTAEDLGTAMNHALSVFGRPPRPLDLLSSYVGDGLDVFLSRAFETEDSQILSEAKKVYKEYYSEHLTVRTRLYPGVVETLIRLTEKGISCFVLTNKADMFVGPILEALGIAGYFTAAFGQYRFKRIKPDPEGVDFILGTWGFRAGEALIVGDNHTDIETGRNAGVRSVFCSFGIGHTAGRVPDFVLEVFSDLLDVVGLIGRTEGNEG